MADVDCDVRAPACSASSTRVVTCTLPETDRVVQLTQCAAQLHQKASLSEKLAAAKPVTWRGKGDLLQYN